MNFLPALLLAASWAAAAPKPKDSFVPAEMKNFKITFLMKHHAMERAGAFLVGEGEQVNGAVGGERPFEVENNQGVGAEYKKEAAIVNCVVQGVPGRPEFVRAECQFELAGAGEPALKRTQARPISSFQHQAGVLLKKGKTHVLVEEKDRRIELRVDDAPVE